MSEFNWLPNSIKKQVPYYPELVISDCPDHSGAYYMPCKYYPKGLIEISTTTSDYASTLAHEFRHHWQRFNFVLNNRRLCWYDLIENYEYKDAIKLYFNRNIDEKDALLFEYKTVKADISNYWIKHILKWKV